jgi:hypothetical protein
MESYLMEDKNVLEMNGRDGYMWVSVMALNCTLKTEHLMYILTQFKGKVIVQ